MSWRENTRFCIIRRQVNNHFLWYKMLGFSSNTTIKEVRNNHCFLPFFCFYFHCSLVVSEVLLDFRKEFGQSFNAKNQF